MTTKMKRLNSEKFENAKAENVEEHLLHLLNQMKIVEEKNMKILSDGYSIPKQSNKWLKDARRLTNEVQYDTKNVEEQKLMCQKIYDCMKNCPFEDKINQRISFVASMHGTEDGTLSESKHEQTAKKETVSSEVKVIMTSRGRVHEKSRSELKRSARGRVGSRSKKGPFPDYGVGKKFKSEIIELDDDAQDQKQKTWQEESDPNDEFAFSREGGLSTEKTPPELKRSTRGRVGSRSKKGPLPDYGVGKKFKSEIIELDDDAQDQQQKTWQEESDPNDEFAFSGKGGLSTEKTPPELGPIIPISITGEISVEVSSSSSSQETSNLNRDFSLDPNKKKQSSTSSLPEHLMSTTGTLKVDEIVSSGEGGLRSEKNPPKLCLIIPISVTGEMSKYMNLRVEVPSSSNSQETSDLNSVFGLDPNKEKYSFSELELEKQRVNSPIPVNLIVMSTTGTPRTEEWRGAVVVNLIEKNILSLVEKPDCPNLVLLFLQRNKRLSSIPLDFFNQMPALRFLDFSETRIRALPSSLFKLINLELLMLRSCVCLESLPGEVENLTKLKVLDLSGTDLFQVPQELRKVDGLRLLHLQLYHPDYKSGNAGLPSEFITPDAINTMNTLESLSIVVHPEDQRWKNIVEDIIKHIRELKTLSYLHFYFPTVEALHNFTSSGNQRLSRFNFIVGDDVKRIISRVPSEVESKYNENEKCLRFVNGNKVDEVMKTTLKLATAFYLDHHLEAKSISDFGISNCKELRFCVVRECPKLEFFITRDEESNESAFPNLEYLGLHYLWELKQIWKDPIPSGSFKPLLYLMVANCQKLEYIASHSILKCLSNLMTFIIEDCESLKYIVEDNEKVEYGNKNDALLPKLTKLQLRYLPELEALGSGILFPLEKINVEYCPKLTLKAKPQKLGFLNFIMRGFLNFIMRIFTGT